MSIKKQDICEKNICEDVLLDAKEQVVAIPDDGNHYKKSQKLQFIEDLEKIKCEDTSNTQNDERGNCVYNNKIDNIVEKYPSLISGGKRRTNKSLRAKKKNARKKSNKKRNGSKKSRKSRKNKTRRHK